MKKGTTTFLKAAIIIIGFFVFALCIWVPGLARSAAELNPEYPYLKIPVLVGLYIAVIPFFLSLYLFV
ncbi:DUF2975 domain-containing protein [Bacillus salitolerans]|uniref:DUF2975 domain-containing protein n=1 Tax=Bacillus salitolerans TaxID=1437434 RepID=A0ABW4LXE8_9BACI